MVNPIKHPLSPPTGPLSLTEHQIDVRVRYQETDAQGRVHHATYINYFEIGRVEYLRAVGYSYRQLEADGIHLVVTEISCNYFKGAMYDDLLRLTTRVRRARGVRIEHEYELTLDGELVVSGRSVVASVDPSGKIKRLPDWLQLPR